MEGQGKHAGRWRWAPSLISSDVDPAAGRQVSITLHRREVETLCRLIASLQANLEASIDSELIQGESEPRDPAFRPIVAGMRKQWRDAENLMKILEAALPAKPDKTQDSGGTL